MVARPRAANSRESKRTPPPPAVRRLQAYQRGGSYAAAEGGLILVQFDFPMPRDEPARLDALRSYNVLDTPPEKEFDDLARLAAMVCGCPVASLTFVDAERQWYKARFGFDLLQDRRESAGFCSNAILQRSAMIVPDALADERFVNNPAVVEFGLRFYAGVPLVNRENLVLGTLCVLDRVPRQIAPEQLDALHVLARQVLAQLELRRVAIVGELRERLLSILSNDLRQPLQQILIAARQGVRPMGSGSPEQRSLTQIAISAERMTRGVRDALDFARTRLGNGLPLRPRPTTLAMLCRRVVREYGLSYPGREILLEVSNDGAGMWDEDRVAQALSNLVANALRYGAPARPLRISCSGDESECVVSVHNEGNPIPPAVIPRLFAPFCRSAPREGVEPPIIGLGLGLYVVREVTAACGGSVEVDSSPESGTTFRLRLPRRVAPADPSRAALRH
jgi:signal transduction histidine kinase